MVKALLNLGNDIEIEAWSQQVFVGFSTGHWEEVHARLLKPNVANQKKTMKKKKKTKKKEKKQKQKQKQKQKSSRRSSAHGTIRANRASIAEQSEQTEQTYKYQTWLPAFLALSHF